jgi:hypothetical protein
MAIHAHIGFLQDEESINSVDIDFKELVRLTYSILGFGSYGVSCSGHFYKESNKFYPEPWGHLQFAALPQMPHILELVKLIHEYTKEDPDANLKMWENIPPYKFKIYSPENNLRNYEIAKTETGLYIVRFEIRLGDNGCLKPVEPYYGGGIKTAGNKAVFKESRKRCNQIKEFWKSLEQKVREYNQVHEFSSPDFSKKEFEPF